MGELFASDVKGVASAIAVMFNWTLVFIITKTFGMMQLAWGSGECCYSARRFAQIKLTCIISRSNFLLLRWFYGHRNNLRFHQSTGNKRQIKRSNPSHSCRKELRPETLRPSRKTQHSQHHHIETKFLSQDFLKCLF